YKAANEKRGRDFGRGKPYGREGKKPDEGGTSGGKVGGIDKNCFKCGLSGHHFFECPKKDWKCFKCGDLNHKTDQCPKGVVCFNCKEDGHKSNVCKKPRAAGGKVFAL
ncbi:cellular nucleic acid-binding protein, partial [Trifolium medium]|nr:cellular nucleic acid-binding protein [Trifolium medium]